MDILKIQVINGPNFWSIKHKKLIVFKLDIKQYEYLPSNLIKEFPTNLKKLLPSLYHHRCSEGIKGGFFERLEEGTWLGHVTEHIALELQYLAGMDCGFGRTFSAETPGVYNVIFAYRCKKAGLYAGKTAIKIVETLAHQKPYLNLEKDLEKLRKYYAEEKAGPSTQAIIDEATKRNIPVRILKDSSLMVLGQGLQQRKVWATLSAQTAAVGVDIASDKDITKKLLDEAYIPIPKSRIVSSVSAVSYAVEKLGFPLVIKPLNGNHGKGITTNIRTEEQAIHAFHFAAKVSPSVIVERFIEGKDYRFLIVNYQVVAVAQRTAAFVIGNGVSSIRELIDEINKDPKRGSGHDNVLTEIQIDESTLSILKEKQLNPQSVLPLGEIVSLKYTANLSSGGTATDVTDEVHKANLELGERVARIMNLDICGIDIIAKDIQKPINKQNGAVLEVNASPGFRMHLSPCNGKPRNVAAYVLDMLYPQNISARIPIIAVTGTNGKTTVVQLIAHFAKKFHRVGYTTTEGIYSNGRLIYKGDCSGPKSARAVLQDTTVDFAVLECARGGILREGLGFDQCNISIITNISNDHLGLQGIDSLERLAKVKGVVAETTASNGYAILNADDDLVYGLKEELHCQVALFALSEQERIRSHCASGGIAIYLQDKVILLQKGTEKEEVIAVDAIPCTFGGTASSMIKNILPALLAATLSGFPLKEIVHSLGQFRSNAEMNPGRMNLYEFDNFNILLDYAHNEGAYEELKSYIHKVNAKKKIGIITAVGDRRDEDIQGIGFIAAQMFDEIIIRHNEDKRGRLDSELTELLLMGIQKISRQIKVDIISNEVDALNYAISHAKEGTFIYHCIDDVSTAINYMNELSKKSDFDSVKGNYYYGTTKREVAYHRWSRG